MNSFPSVVSCHTVVDCLKARCVDPLVQEENIPARKGLPIKARMKVAATQAM